jgi:hypothetical protein
MSVKMDYARFPEGQQGRFRFPARETAGIAADAEGDDKP